MTDLTEWLAPKLRAQEDVVDVTILSSNGLQIRRSTKPTVVVAAIAAPKVDTTLVISALATTAGASLITNLPNDSFFTGDAISTAKSKGAVLCTVGDTLRALAMTNVTQYVRREIVYIERGLQQHKSVVAFNQLDDWRYEVRTASGRKLIVVFCPNYSLSADAVRTAVGRYGTPDMMVKTHPNGEITTAARDAATGIGTRLLTWSEFYGALNKQ
jgi:hypothetical protein